MISFARSLLRKQAREEKQELTISSRRQRWRIGRRMDIFNWEILKLGNFEIEFPNPKISKSQISNMDLLRFITAGSVDDGKSTLIGRLLYDSKSIMTNQLKAIEKQRKNE